jgi:hypothetical protein
MAVPDVLSERGERREAALGTRFLVYPQPPYIPGYEKPETIWVSTPSGGIEAGPSDSQIYVIVPDEPKEPYEFPYLPPFEGRSRPPVRSGPEGHFDHLVPGTPDFVAAHAYACVRRVLDICESYHGEAIRWFFEPARQRLEIIPRLQWDNAHSGFGYLELGEDDMLQERLPLALNFDAIAHETGHLVLLSTLRTPKAPPEDFFAYHECAADFVSLLSLLHFDTALDRILRRTRGNLLLMNELDRFAELSFERQVRTFNHSLKMRDVGAEVHDRARPFMGALFDTLVEIYQILLVERGLSSLDPREVEDIRLELTQKRIDSEFAITRDEYAVSHFEVKAALEEARDIMGLALARSWRAIDPDSVTLESAAEALADALQVGRGERFLQRLIGNFEWREIL